MLPVEGCELALVDAGERGVHPVLGRDDPVRGQFPASTPRGLDFIDLKRPDSRTLPGHQS